MCQKMSMPQPISVALVAREESQLSRLRRKFRLGIPGIGPATYCALDSPTLHPAKLPKNSVHLWLAMDDDCFAACSKLAGNADRGFYADRFPEVVVRVARDSELEAWAKRIEKAYLSTS